MESDVGRMLGFEKNTVISGKFTAGSFVSTATNGLNYMYIYSDIVRSQFVGDVKVPLLRVVPLKGRYGTMTNYNFEKPHYICK